MTSDPALLVRKIRTALGPCTLGSWPTPLDAASALADASGVRGLWIKREDRSSPFYGGNKVRGLEFLFAGAPPRTVFVTVGGTGSTHCLATAVHAKRIRCHCVVAEFPQPETPIERSVFAACRAAATDAVYAGSRVGTPLAILRAWRRARTFGIPWWIPGGGAVGVAVVGHMLAGLELANQLPAPPDAIVTPLGTGGTSAGLVLGVAALGWPTRVVAVRVAPWPVASAWRVGHLVKSARRILARRGVEVSGAPRAALVVNGIGRGYGYPSAAGEAARVEAQRHGLSLDPTYGAKAFAALPALAASGFQRVVFWHTFAFPGAEPSQ